MAPFLWMPGVVREDEREQRQGDGHVQVAGGRVERELVVLAERQRDKAQDITDEDEEEGGADEREPGIGAARHRRPHDAVSRQGVQQLEERLDAPRLRLEDACDHDRDGHENGRRQPQVDHGLGDREVDRADGGQLDDRLDLEFLRHLERLRVAAGDQEETDHGGQPDQYPDPRQTLLHKVPARPAGAPARDR